MNMTELTKEQLVELLVLDFVKVHPESTRWERMEVAMRLRGFDLVDLQLLCKAL